MTDPESETGAWRFPERYEIRGTIGQGGMGSVLDAWDHHMKRPCAIKVIKKEYAGNHDLMRRFRSEAELTAGLNHPNIIQIWDINLEGENPFFVMEKFAASSLQAFSHQAGELRLKRLLNIFLQVIKGLRAAFRQKLLHRDIKPENLLIDDDDNVKIIDFGLSKQQVGDAQGTDYTQTGMIMGTPTYMSPEQCRSSRSVTHKSDIYSAGATFYALLTGTPPFSALSFADYMFKHCQDPRPRANETLPGIPETLSDLIVEMMAIDPEKRPEYDDVLARLEAVEEVTPPGLAIQRCAAGNTISVVRSQGGSLLSTPQHVGEISAKTTIQRLEPATPTPPNEVPVSAGRGFKKKSAALILIPLLLFALWLGQAGRGIETRAPDHARLVWHPGSKLWVQETEVTNGQYALFLADVEKRGFLWCHPLSRKKNVQPAYAGERAFQDPRQPVVGVDFYAAWAYARWAGRRLPTKDEWLAMASAFQQTGAILPAEVAGPTPPLAGGDPTDRTPEGILGLVGGVSEWIDGSPDRSGRYEGIGEVLVLGGRAGAGHEKRPFPAERAEEADYFDQSIGFRTVADPD